MVKTIVIKEPKIRDNLGIKKFKRIYYIKEWQLYFDTKVEMEECLNSIAEAEEDIRCGRVAPVEEMWEYFRNELGADI